MNSEPVEKVSTTTLRLQSDSDRVVPEQSDQFVFTPFIQEITDRALTYLDVGYPVHFAGPAGTGKTTLAFHVAACLKRPVILMHGDDEFASSDLVGKDTGYRKSKVVDNYIHSVLKTQEEMSSLWMDNRLTTACKYGYTLIYDEFTRSRPEANNVLLSILEEKVLDLPSLRRYGEGYLQVHPDFRAIFTSNPEEYVGTHKTQDALMDRLITINVGHYDRESEVNITASKSGVNPVDAEIVVDIVREIRSLSANSHHPTVRACIMIARILKRKEAHANWEDPVFQWACRDVLSTGTAKVTKDGKSVMAKKLEDIVQKVCCGEQGKKYSAGLTSN